MQNDVDVVRAIKGDLIRRGVIPDDASRETTNRVPFEITARYAWQRRDQGAKLVLRPTGNNHVHQGVGYSIDVVSFPDGYVDLLGSAGPPANQNEPRWAWTPLVRDPNATNVVAPFDLDAPAAGTEPAPDPAVPHPVVDPPAVPISPDPSVLGELQRQTVILSDLASSLAGIRRDLANGATLLERLAAGGTIADVIGGLLNRRKDAGGG